MLSISFAHAEIISLNTMEEVKAKFEEALENHKGENILGIWDVDYTLIQPSDPSFHFKIIKNYYDVLKDLMKNLTNLQSDLVITLMVTDGAHQLIEANTPKIVKDLENKKIKMIALTAAKTGKICSLPSFEEWRIKQLKDYGFDFTSTFKGEISFTKLVAYGGTHPLFKSGVLFSNGEKSNNTKGDVAVAFLMETKLTPEVIIAIDDKKENLTHLEHALKKYNPNIIFIGIHYKGALQSPPVSVDQKIFVDTWQKLINEVVALTDKEKCDG